MNVSGVIFFPLEPKKQKSKKKNHAWSQVKCNLTRCAWKLWFVEETFSKNLSKNSFTGRLYFQLRANGRSNSQQYWVRLHGAKSLTGFKLCATTPNNTQQHATLVCKRSQHVTSNNVASVCSGNCTLNTIVHVERSFPGGLKPGA